MEQEITGDVVHLTFSKAFYLVPHGILISKLISCALDKWIIRCMAGSLGSEGCKQQYKVKGLTHYKW